MTSVVWFVQWFWSDANGLTSLGRRAQRPLHTYLLTYLFTYLLTYVNLCTQSNFETSLCSYITGCLVSKAYRDLALGCNSLSFEIYKCVCILGLKYVVNKTEPHKHTLSNLETSTSLVCQPASKARSWDFKKQYRVTSAVRFVQCF